MRFAVRVLPGPAVCLSLLAASAPAAAAPKPISGELSRPGYTVIALASDGSATAARAPRGRFSLVPPAANVTLHLRAPDGVYAGPVVSGGGGKRAIVGVRAGARLGRVSVRSGYARVARSLSRKALDKDRRARARRGIPIGARVFGRVRSRLGRDSLPGDRDVDGVPDPLDVDDDGDLILDSLDRSTRGRAAQAASSFGLFSVLRLDLHETANANAAPPGSPLTSVRVNAALSGFGQLVVNLAPGDSVELDCGGANQLPPRPEGLRYCSAGGTGSVLQPGGSQAPLPGSPGGPLDPDGDGFGTLVGEAPPGGSVRSVFLKHGAATDEIGTGDVLIEWAASGVPQAQCPPPSGPPPSGCASYTATLEFVLATVPALLSYDDDGPTGSAPTPVTYPVAAPPPPQVPGEPPGGGPGTPGNGFPVTPCPAGAPAPCKEGDIVVTLTFWRPQRPPIAGEACLLETPRCAWIDIGGLTYTTVLGPSIPSSFTGGPCPQSAYSAFSPPLVQGPAYAPGFTDTLGDRPASADSKLTFALNLTQCLGSLGASWAAGEEVSQVLAGRLSPAGELLGGAGQGVTFKRR